MNGRVFVCLTCNRYATQQPGEPTLGERMARATKLASAHAGSPVTVRMVVCLNGCPNPCTAALREPGKCAIRFSQLTADDAPALIEAATLYAASTDGDLSPDALPQALRGKISAQVDMQAA